MSSGYSGLVNIDLASGNGGDADTTRALKSATTTVNVSNATAPSANQVLTATSSTEATWQTPSTTATTTNALESATTTVNVSSATAPSSGQVLTATSGTAATWQTPSTTATTTNALESATTTVNVSSATAPSSGQVLTATSGTAATWQTPAAGWITQGTTLDLSSTTQSSSISTGALIVDGGIGCAKNITSTSLTLGSGSILSNYVANTAWTPVLTFGGANVGMTGSFTATYSRIGSIVCFRATVSLTAKGSSTGDASVSGLPLSPAAYTCCSVRYDRITFTGSPQGAISSGGLISLEMVASGGSSATLTNTAFVNNSEFEVSGMIIV